MGAYVSDGPQLVCFGANAADPHHAPGHDVVKSGDCVVFDIFTPIRRYWCDMTRTVYFKEAGEEERRIYALVKAANQAGIDAVRPGVPLRDIDRAARRVIEEGGYRPLLHPPAGPRHRPGMPRAPGRQRRLGRDSRAGMVFSIEPGIYLPGRTGVRIEDLVLVTETGCEVLNAAPKDLRVVG